jgi:hypothetical protein
MMSKKHKALLAEWQERLGMTDWRIKLKPKCKPEEMAQEGSGCVEWSESIKSARIEILDPAYYGKRVVPFDWEKTLVHELLHLKTSLVSDSVDKLQERVMHQMIDDLARALVSAKRSLAEPASAGAKRQDAGSSRSAAPNGQDSRHRSKRQGRGV